MAQNQNPPDPQPDSMPDWLRDQLADQTSGSALDSVPGTTPDSNALPDWFTSLTEPAPDSGTEAVPPGLPAQSSRTLRDRADEPRPIPDSDLPAWMREMAPAETVSQPVTPPPMAPPPPARPAVPEAKSPAPKPPPVTPAAPPDAGSGVLLGGEISSADIDALINLPMDTYAPAGSADDEPTPLSEQDIAVLYGDAPANVTYAEPEPPPPAYDYGDYGQTPSGNPPRSTPSAEALLTLDEDSLDRLLGPMEPAPNAPVSRMASAAANVVPLSAGGSTLPSARADLLNPDRAALPAEDLPDFVSELRPEDAPVQLSIGGQTLDIDETPASDLDPALQQLRERSRAAQQFRPSPPKSVGPLAEIAGTLMAEPVLIRAVVNATATPRVNTAQAIPTVEQLRRVDVLKRLLDVEEATYTSVTTAGARLRRRLRIDGERLFVTLLLLAALVAPFFTDKVNLATSLDAAGTQPNSAEAAAYRVLDGLGQGQPVLVAFDYGPTATGELDDLAVEMLHEVLVHGAHPILVSTDGAGLLHAEALISAFGHDPGALAALNRTTPLVNQADYTVLRYLPAGAVGVHALADAIYHDGSLTSRLFLAADAQGQPLSPLSSDQLTSLHAAPVIILAETSDVVQAWAEQYRPPQDVTAPQPTLLFATTAAAAITAQTYSAANPTGIVGPLIGLRDAIAYRVLRPSANPPSNPPPNPPANPSPAANANGSPGTANPIGSPVSATTAILDQRWQSISLSALVAALLIVLGALFGILTRTRQRGRRL